MLYIEIKDELNDDEIIEVIRQGIEKVKAKNIPIKYLLVHNLMAQWFHEKRHTKKYCDGYYFGKIQVIHSYSIELHECYILTNLQPTTINIKH